MVHFEDKCGSNLIIPQKKKLFPMILKLSSVYCYNFLSH